MSVSYGPHLHRGILLSIRSLDPRYVQFQLEGEYINAQTAWVHVD
ncbi:hypothetical protein Enr17x_18870 [Gimesia fumaroli]|uniref:Uncharacterized protein n=1 Tax=Gimesia fumaroli TaxID=2527976 RepID=A0A518I9R7_9PLAN|nr:hypothetical protein Enr17x_18870 [Gimesia fumaroli]